MRATLSGERFTLSRPQLSAALALARVEPRPGTGLPPPSAPRRLANPLKGSVLVAGKGELRPGVAEAVTVLARADRRLVVRQNRAGQPEWSETQLVRRTAGGPVVAVAGDDDQAQLTVLADPSDVRRALESLLTTGGAAEEETAISVELSADGFAALLALADVLQDVALRARLARERARLPQLTPDALEHQLQRGVATAHTRWAVTAGRLVAPIDLAAAGRMPDGLDDLVGAGLVERAAGGGRVTRPGFALADALGNLALTASMTVLAASGDGALAEADRLALFRTATTTIVARWSGSADRLVVTVEECSEGALRDLVEDALALDEGALMGAGGRAPAVAAELAKGGGEPEPVAEPLSREALDPEAAPTPATGSPAARPAAEPDVVPGAPAEAEWAEPAAGEEDRAPEGGAPKRAPVARTAKPPARPPAKVAKSAAKAAPKRPTPVPRPGAAATSAAGAADTAAVATPAKAAKTPSRAAKTTKDGGTIEAADRATKATKAAKAEKATKTAAKAGTVAKAGTAAKATKAEEKPATAKRSAKRATGDEAAAQPAAAKRGATAAPTTETTESSTASSDPAAAAQREAARAAVAAAMAANPPTIPNWNPTHVVPDGGMPAWAAPDPTQQPVATLGARLPVEVREERGAWAHVLCSNGWRGWVDGRRLVSVD